MKYQYEVLVRSSPDKEWEHYSYHTYKWEIKQTIAELKLRGYETLLSPIAQNKPLKDFIEEENQ